MADETKTEEKAPTPNPEVLARYSQLVSDMRASVANYFPDLAPNIYIVDPTKPIDEEIARATQQLGAPNLRERIARQNDGIGRDLMTNAGIENTSAATVTLWREDADDIYTDLHYDITYRNNPTETLDLTRSDLNHNIAIVFPTYPASLAKVQDLLGNDFTYHVHSLSHEAGHAVSLINPEFKKAAMALATNGIINKDRYNALVETLAETYAYDVGMRSGLLSSSYVDHTLANRDLRLRDKRSLMYNATDEFESIRKDYPKEGFGPYSGFHDLRGSFNRALDAQKWNLSEEELVHATFINQSLETANFRDVPDRYIDAHDKISPQLRKILPFSERIDAAENYVYGQSELSPADYHPAPTPPIDALRTAASLWLLDQKGDKDGITDKSSQTFMSTLLQSYIDYQKQRGKDLDITPDVIANLAKHTENNAWAQEFLAGAPIETALKHGIASIQRYESDHGLPSTLQKPADQPTPSVKR